MPETNCNVIQGGFKPEFGSTSYVEAILKRAHGEDLHAVVSPLLAAGKSQQEIADELSTTEYRVTQSWLSNWLRDNGYRRQWIRRQNGGAQ